MTQGVNKARKSAETEQMDRDKGFLTTETHDDSRPVKSH